MAWKKELQEKDKRYVWHPFTPMGDWLQQEPLIIERGEGNFLIDVEGRRYLDGVSSLWCNVHGHRKREIDQAIQEQLEKIAHSTLLGLANVPSILLAEKLVQIAPKGLVKVFYSDNGATAVEVALKMAFQYWQQKGGRYRRKTKFAFLTNAYHGDTLGAVSVGGIDLFHKLYRPLLFEAFQVMAPYCYRCPLTLTYPDCGVECIGELRQTIREHHEELAAFIAEPMIQGAAGMIVFPEGFLREAWELCKAHEVLFIADEVATGFGRTGRMFACEHEGITPDLMAVAKGLSGGYLPLAATLTTQEIFDGFLGRYEELKTFFHGHTFTGNPLACAAALANLELFEKERLLEKLPPKIARLQKGLERFKALPHVGDVRQLGLMVGIELVQEKATKQPYPLEKRIGYQVTLEARKRGVIIRPLGDVIVLMPPLSITDGELDFLLDVVYASIWAVTTLPKVEGAGVGSA